MQDWRAPDDLHLLSDAVSQFDWISSSVPKNIEFHNLMAWEPTDPSVGRDRIAFEALARTYGYARDKRGSSSIQVIIERVNRPNIYPFIFPEIPEPSENLTNIGDLYSYKDLVVTPSFGVPVPVSTRVPTLTHALALWKSQSPGLAILEDFETRKGCDEIALKLFGWSRRGSLLAAAKIATCWRQVLESLEESEGDPTRVAAQLCTDPKWSRRLGNWAKGFYSPVLGISDSDQTLTVVA